jgi:hypothetical protein
MQNKSLVAVVIFLTALGMISSCKKNIEDPITLNPATANQTIAFQTPQGITIEAHSVRGCPLPGSCHFIASGAFTDEGTIVTDTIFSTAIPAPTVGGAHWVRTFVGQYGSITIQEQLIFHVSPSDPNLGEESGQWIISSATGDYEDLHGGGTVTGIRNFEESQLDVVYTGLVH